MTKPSYKQALGTSRRSLSQCPDVEIGLSLRHLISEPVGALTCAFIVKNLAFIKLKGHSALPVLTGFCGNLHDGGAFVTILKFVMDLPNVVYFTAMLPLMSPSRRLNAIVTPLMYFPALRLFVSRGILDSLEEQEAASDHSMYELKPTQEGLISMEHLSYIYTKQKTPVLDDVNLTVQRRFSGHYR